MKHTKPSRKIVIDNKTLKKHLLSVYSDNYTEEKKGIKIRCPWHSPDNNPSCLIFYGTGLFFCVVCHGDKPKGKRGVSPYNGFQTLGMSEAKARSIFINGTPTSLAAMMTTQLPDLNEITPLSRRGQKNPESKVMTRETWPRWWGFREIHCTTLQQPWCVDRFHPQKIYLEKERLPRISLSIGGHERLKNTQHPDYLKSEVCLRLSSIVKRKAVNSLGLNLDPDVRHPLPATLFGLINNQLDPKCKGIILVEGPYDCLRLLQHVHDPRIGGVFEVVALLGTPQWDNTRKQIITYLMPTILKKNIPIILAFDHDLAGEKLTATAQKTLQAGYIPRVMILDYPKEVKDPGDLSFDTFHTSIYNTFDS